MKILFYTHILNKVLVKTGKVLSSDCMTSIYDKPFGGRFISTLVNDKTGKLIYFLTKDDLKSGEYAIFNNSLNKLDGSFSLIENYPVFFLSSKDIEPIIDILIEG